MEKSVLERSMTPGDGEHCMQCGRVLTRDEIGLHKKMINRGATEFMCVTCLARHFEVTEADIEERIRHFKAMGCTLFEPQP